jgi:protocatechuate 3,4-dioxygenase beta subunit
MGSVAVVASSSGAYDARVRLHSRNGIVAALVACWINSVAAFAQVPASEPAPRKATAEQLRGAQWVEGRVVVPVGTPPEERLTVVADAAGLPAFDQHAAPVDAEGKFRVAFAADAKRGMLRVQGRFLFLDPEASWKAGDPAADLRLKPVLGAYLKGRVLLPEGMGAKEREEVLAADVELEGTPNSPGLRALKRYAHIAPDLGFEFPALPNAYQWTVTIAAGPCMPFQSEAKSSEPGVTLAVECALARGATVRGKVVDEAGKPMADAVLDVVSHSDPLAPAPRDVRDVRSKADGSFEIRGVAPGVVTLWAKREGCISVDTELPALAAGETRADVTLLLRTGNVLMGRAVDASGKAMAGARVRLTQARLGQADLVRELVTGPDGTFAVPGLGDERVDVLATRDLDEPGAAGGAPPAKKRTLRATVAQIDPKTRDLVLTLIAGLVVEGRVHDDLGRAVLSYTVGARRATPDGKTTTDAAGFRRLDVRTSDGTFAFEGLEPGKWDVYVFGRGIVYEPAQRISVPHEGDPLLFVVRRPAVVAGVVLDSQRKGVDGAVVEVQWTRPPLYKGAPSQESTSVTCDREGRFEITDVFPGEVRVLAKLHDGPASPPQLLTLESGGRKEGVEVLMPAGGPR